MLPGLAAFEHEGIQNITALKDQLVAANHDQTPAIKKRHQDVIARSVELIVRITATYIRNVNVCIVVWRD